MAARKLRQHEAPISEQVEKKHHEWTEEQCIQELQRIAKLDTSKVITRNYFRVHSLISESTWNRYFGTFEEYKRQAGITLSRQQHQLEKQIAKQASVDHYRELNRERLDWGDKYRIKNKQRFQTVVSCSDLHDANCDPFYLDVLVDTVKRLQPDVIQIVGDLFDLPEFGKYTVDPRLWDPVGRIKAAHEILRRLREACPDTEIVLIEGNHEFRLVRHMADATPALMTVLADLHGMTVGKLLGLDQYQVNYVAKADLAAYTVKNITDEVAKNYRVYYGCFMGHHYPHGKEFGIPGVNGHHHNWLVLSMFSEVFGSYQWMQLGGGHVRDASYTNGQKWSNGFGIAHIDTQKKLVNQEYISVTDFACSGGKYYYR